MDCFVFLPLNFFDFFDFAVYILHSYLWVKFSQGGRGVAAPPRKRVLEPRIGGSRDRRPLAGGSPAAGGSAPYAYTYQEINHEKHERYEKKRNNEMITSKNFVLFVSFVVKMNQSK
ncbi:MAG: hypothetical protein LBQ35_00210, partial [Spirochaetaceae bacterium]|nr:hypothetical protein [Spirochaetaceae bacterium]